MASDLYADLGVSRDADDKQIKTAYRRLARRFHPDVNPGNEQAEARFKRVNEAYQVLSDPRKRRDYDEFGDNWKHAEQIRASGGSRGSGFRGGGGWRPASGGIAFEDLFAGMGFGNGIGRPQRRSLRTFAQITLDEAYAGSKRSVTIEGAAPCSTCHGSGVDGAATCQVCGGRGVTSHPRTLEVTIPRGTASGDKIRVRPDDGTEVTIEVEVREHRVFARKGDDLVVDVPVSYLQALLGGEAEVPTMTGKVALTIPAGTVEGRSFRLAGKGMPRHGRSATGHGDLIARAVITVPAGTTERERDLLEQLRGLRSASAGRVQGGGG